MVSIGKPDTKGNRRKGVTGRADIQVGGASKGRVVQGSEIAGRAKKNLGKVRCQADGDEVVLP